MRHARQGLWASLRRGALDSPCGPQVLACARLTRLARLPLTAHLTRAARHMRRLTSALLASSDSAAAPVMIVRRESPSHLAK